MNFDTFTSELVAARPFFKTINPGPSMLVRGRVAGLLRTGKLGLGALAIHRSGAEAADVVGEVLGSMAVRKLRAPLKNQIVKAHRHIPTIEARDPLRKNGMGGRSWYTAPARHEMVIVFHDANRAGPHIDVHLGRLSVVYRVKPDLYAQLRYNREGYLTDDSKKLLIAHVRSEIGNGSRVPQNLDHSLSNARATWTDGDPTAKHYGSGPTRQVVSTSSVDIYKAHRDGPIEMYAPLLNPNRALYMYRLYPGDNKRAPILIWGAKSAAPPALDDRLHLKLMHPEELEDKVAARVDMTTSTAKYDGSSCYVVITSKGTTVWSPRTSVTTGEQIEYTHKLDGLANLHSDQTIVAMGELLFTEKPRFPWEKPHFYLPSASGSGILNSNAVLPRNIRPEIRLYRVDRVGRQNVGDLDFWENRAIQERIAALHPTLKVVDLMSPSEARAKGFEGIVAVPPDSSVNDGVKVKWWTDPNDWRIDSVEFKPGDKGGLAGVIWTTSLDSGKRFKLGPGQVGNRALTEDMMANPERYEGAVLKVNSRHGHEGRAAKVVAFHDDKGVAII